MEKNDVFQHVWNKQPIVLGTIQAQQNSLWFLIDDTRTIFLYLKSEPKKLS
jgi:hypothetical protein